MAEQRIARIIDGKAIAQAIIREIQQDVEQFKQLYDRVRQFESFELLFLCTLMLLPVSNPSDTL